MALRKKKARPGGHGTGQVAAAVCGRVTGRTVTCGVHAASCEAEERRKARRVSCRSWMLTAPSVTSTMRWAISGSGIRLPCAYLRTAISDRPKMAAN